MNRGIGDEEIRRPPCYSKGPKRVVLCQPSSLSDRTCKCPHHYPNKMDHSNIASSHFFQKNKAIDSFMKLPIMMMRMIAHSHGDF